MGSYLGKQEPPARGMGRGARELKERLTKPNPAVPTPARRLSFRETPVVSNRTFMSPRRRYPTHQPQYSMPGSLPTVYIDGFPRKTLLSPKHSQIRSPMTVKIARPDSNIARSPVLNSLLSPGLASPSCTPPDPCAKETVLNAIRESKKRMNKDEDYSASGGTDNKRRRQFSSGSGESSAESAAVNGSLSSFSKSDTLKRALNTQLLDETANKRSRTSSNSSLSSCAINGFTMPTHNAITSSFSSSRVLLQKRKRNCHNSSVVSSSPSSRSQTPDLSAKKAREEPHEVSQSTPVKSASGDQSGQSIETPSSKSSALNSSVDNGSGGPRRKKVLLVCSGRGDQYPLPPPPVVGYNITSKDLDSEKKAFLQRLNKALEETSDSIPVSSVPSTTAAAAASPPLFSLSTTSALTSQTSAAVSNPLLQSLAKMQNKEGPLEPVQAVAAEFPSQKAPSLGLSSKDNSGPCQNAPLKLMSPPSAAVSSNSTSQLDAGAQNKPESKSSLLQLLTQPSGNDSQSSFKPLFPSTVSSNPPSVSSSGPSLPSVSSTNTFKPIFKEQNVQQNQPASTFKPIFGDSSIQEPARSASPFTFQVNSNPTSTAPSFSGFGATSTSTTPSTEGATKPSLPLLTSSSATHSFSSTFSGGITSSSAAASAPTNTFLASSTSSGSQTKTKLVFGQAPTSQATPGLNVFGNTQTAPTSQPPQASVFGSAASAFSAPLNSNPLSFPASSGASTFNSGSGSGVQAAKPATNPLASFGTSGGQSAFGSGAQPTFGSSSQSAFGANSQPAFGSSATFSFGSASATTNPTAFGTMNSAQTNSTPATSQFGAAKPFNFGEKSNSAVTFGATTSAVPAPVMSFGNSSGAQNSTSLSFGTPGPTENKLPFGTPATPFGQNTAPAPNSFGTPTQSFGSPNSSFGQANHGFSIGVTSKTSGARQRLMARRQHTRKKT